MKLKTITTAVLLGVFASTGAIAADNAAASSTGASGDNVLNSGKAPAPATTTGASQGDMLSGSAASPAGSSANANANANADMSASASSSANFDSDSQIVRQAQQALKDKGQHIKVDGIMGPKTRAAIKAYQKENGLQASGKLDALTLTDLGVEQSGSVGASLK